ncbi:MAG: haloacid dehalogenase type II [Rhodospirillales bacterium]|nr:haloacid dehalogenase type II [Rhodospirillales bacterium]
MSGRADLSVRALVFDVFGTVVDWRSSLIGLFAEWGARTGRAADWAAIADAWRAAYVPSMDRVRRGEVDWTILDDLHRASLDALLPGFGLGDVDEPTRREFVRFWHRLRPWPDVLTGLHRLRDKYLLGTLSNGNVGLLARLAKSASLPFDIILGGDLFRHYKPDPQTYRGACGLLNLEPAEVMLVAAHNGDLAAARAEGLATGFVPRRGEYGPHQTGDLAASAAWDVVADDFTDLAARLGA